MHGVSGILNKSTADELLGAASEEGWPPYTEIPWQNGVRLAVGGGVIKCPSSSIGRCSKMYTIIAVTEHVPMEMRT